MGVGGRVYVLFVRFRLGDKYNRKGWGGLRTRQWSEMTYVYFTPSSLAWICPMAAVSAFLEARLAQPPSEGPYPDPDILPLHVTSPSALPFPL